MMRTLRETYQLVEVGVVAGVVVGLVVVGAVVGVVAGVVLPPVGLAVPAAAALAREVASGLGL